MGAAVEPQRAVDPRARLGSCPGDDRRRAWWIAGGYLVLGIVWILWSDRLLGDYGTIKGVGYVVVTAGLLALLIRRGLADAWDANARLAQQEQELRRAGGLYTALTHVNQTIVRRPARDELFVETCRVLVEAAGFDTAWVGQRHVGEHQLVPVVRYGASVGFVDEIEIFTDDRPEGRGPTGIALREGRPYICDDMVRDPVMAPWADVVARYPLRSLASFPFEVGGADWGALIVYRTETGYFGDAEIELLSQVAADISHALENIERDAEQTRAEAALHAERVFSDTMIDSMPGVVYFYDADGTFLRWNRNFEAVSGYSAEEIARMHPLDFFEGADRARVEERIEQVFIDGEAAVEAGFVHHDGHTTPYLFTGRRVEWEGRTCLVGVGIDISERVRATQALHELNEGLERTVAERTAELSTALVQAEAADRIKSAFLATMSHELRTPLNSIIGFTGIVLQEMAGPLTPEQSTQLGMVRHSARHLLALINDVLDISKIEAGQLEVSWETFDLASSVAHVTGAVAPMADAKGLRLETQIDADLGSMTSDRRRVEQILLNLLSNAVKFTVRGGVTLVVERDDRDDRDERDDRDDIVFRVRDTGIGVPADQLGTLFQPFRQLDTGLTRQHEGTGLGLAICRRLAELMGGDVTAASEIGVGSEFTVVLPRDASSVVGATA
jgi:PAS domain S-box-containing protein